MLMLSDSNTQNIYAIPREKYIIQTKPSSDVKIMTYLGNGEFKRYSFGIDLGNLDYESQYFQFDLDENPEIYILPLDLVLNSKSVKACWSAKKTYSNDVEFYSLFMNAIKNGFNELTRCSTCLPASWTENQKNDSIYDEKGLEKLLDYQFESVKLLFSGLKLSELEFSKLGLSKEDKELYIFETCRKLSQFPYLS